MTGRKLVDCLDLSHPIPEMTKKANTDPSFPPRGEHSEEAVDKMLDGLAKPFQLKPTANRPDSAGEHAIEYQAEPRTPPARVEHVTFPNAPVIVTQTDPGIAPRGGPLNVTPEERKRLEEEFEYRRKMSGRDVVERNADTGPRKTDPPGLTTDPPRHGSPLPKLVIAFIALIAICVIAFVATRQPKPSPTNSTTTVTATATATAPVTATTTVAPTMTAPATTTAPTQTSAPTSPTSTTQVRSPTTATATATATTTATATAATATAATAGSTDPAFTKP